MLKALLILSMMIISSQGQFNDPYQNLSIQEAINLAVAEAQMLSR